MAAVTRSACPAERVRARVLDADGHEPADPVGLPARWTSLLPRVRPDSATSPGPGWHPAGIAPLPRRIGLVVLVASRAGDGVHEDLDVAPEPGPVALEPDRLLDGEKRVEPPPLLRRRDIVGEAASRASRGARE